jgi:quercetin dioxygenase-like cupin family protein
VSASEERPARIGGGALPPNFARRSLAIRPGAECVVETADWGDALVVVERGQVELERRGGTRGRFGRGDILWVGAGSLRALRNPGRELALLVAVFRCDEFPSRSPSQLVMTTSRRTT